MTAGSWRVADLSASVADSAVTLFAHPAVAGILGLVIGVGLLAASRGSFRAMRAENPGAGLALVGLLLLGRMGVSALILWAYHAYVTAGFLPFATCFVGGFLVAYGVELARYAGVLRTRTR